MIKSLLIILLIPFTCVQAGIAQDSSGSAVKLFVFRDGVFAENAGLDSAQCERLFTKTQQLVNQVGIVELGYSTFLVSPKMEIVSTSVDQSTVGKVYLAECEFTLSVGRRTIDNQGGAVFKTFAKSVTGAGSSNKDAIRNAVSNIKPSDPEIISFLKGAEEKIDEYYKDHCGDVLKQAQQALALKNYQLAISLYFSVPIGASCYEEARQRSMGVYKSYLDEKCEKNLLTLKAYVALALNNAEYYDKVLVVLGDIETDPTSRCFAQAEQEVSKLEVRFTAEQKDQWDLIKKETLNDSAIEKERYKAMDRISRSYQPAAVGTTVVITH